MVLQMLTIMLYALSSLILIYFSGKIILSFFEINAVKELKLFSNYIVGIIAWILVYSIAKSKFLTINIGLLPAIIFLLYFYRKKIRQFNFEYAGIKGELLLSIAIFLPIFLFQAAFYFDFSNNSFKDIYADSYYYADAANSLKLFGVESTFVDTVYYSNTVSLIPYHYAELWLTALCSELFKVSSICSYFLIVIPLFVSIFSIGLFALVNKIRAHFIFKCLLIIAGVFVSAIYFKVYNNTEILNHDYQADNGILSLFGQKLCAVYVFLLFASTLLLSGYKKIGIIVLAIIPIFSISFLPGLIGGIFLYLILSIIIERRITAYHKAALFAALYAAIFIMLFYQIHKTKYSNEVLNSSTNWTKLISANLGIRDLKLFTITLAYYLLRVLVFYLPFIIPIFFFVKKHRNLALLFCCIIVSGASTTAFLYEVQNATQFLSNPFIVLNLAAFIGLTVLLSDKSLSAITKYISLFIFLLVVGYNINETIRKKSVNDTHGSNDVFVQIANRLDKNPTPILVLLNETSYSSISFGWCWQLRNNLMLLAQYTNKDVIFSIGNPELYFKIKEQIRPSDTLYYKHIFPVNKSVIEGEGLISFINEHNIKYLYLQDGIDTPKGVNISTCITSQKINGSFCILK